MLVLKDIIYGKMSFYIKWIIIFWVIFDRMKILINYEWNRILIKMLILVKKSFMIKSYGNKRIFGC